jgi:hypothetical protein
MTAAQVQRAREQDVESRGMELRPQTEIRPSRPNPPYERKKRKSRIILP